MKKFLVLPLAVLVSVVFFSSGANASHSYSYNNFPHDNLVSNQVFRNSGAMSESEINSFLHSKGGQLASKTFGGKTSARIIYEAAQNYGVNPQVIMTTLQKEQSLITDPNPHSSQYDSAMGYGCPTSGGCSSAYAGFTKQVDNGIWQLRLNYERANGNNTWWNSSISYVCGGATHYYNNGLFPGNSVGFRNSSDSSPYRTVRIASAATASLYCYTPHAYSPNWNGSYNFVVNFEDWFGNPRSQDEGRYKAQWVTQSSYPTIKPGETKTVSITYRNTGFVNWYDNSTASAHNAAPLRLATNKPVNRSSAFGATWGPDRNRPTGNFATVYKKDGSAYATNPHIVQPGESAKFEFTIRIPENYTANTYTQHFIPVAEGVGVVEAPEVFLRVTVDKVREATWKAQSGFPTVKPGDTATAWIEYTNTGNTPWYDNRTAASRKDHPVRLSTSSSDDPSDINRTSPFGQHWNYGMARPTGNFSKVYKTNGNAYIHNPHVVKPGESARFSFSFKIPDNHSPTQVQEWFQPVLDGSSEWDMGGKAWLRLTVPEATTAKPNETRFSSAANPLAIKEKTYTFKNTGNTTWSASNTKLVAKNGEAHRFISDKWESDTIIAPLNEASVAPGETGTFTAKYNVPSDGGIYSFDVGVTVNGSHVSLTDTETRFSVPHAKHAAEYFKQSRYPTIKKGETSVSYFMFKNTGNIPWYDNVANDPVNMKAVVLAATNPINRYATFGDTWGRDRNRPTTQFAAVYESDGTTLAPNQHVVRPGQIGKFEFTFTIPAHQPSGTYRQWFQPIREGGSPWSLRARAFLDVTVP